MCGYVYLKQDLPIGRSVSLPCFYADRQVLTGHFCAEDKQMRVGLIN